MGVTNDIHQFALTRYEAVDDFHMKEAFEQLVQDFDQYVREMRAIMAEEDRLAANVERSLREGTMIPAGDLIAVAELRSGGAE